MSEGNRPVPAQQLLRFLLRLIGSSSLFALVFVAVPYSVMDAIHSGLGMGPLPDQPVVGYLARSTSAFYAIIGGLCLVISFDPERYRTVLLYLGAAFVVFGMILLIVDWSEGMPLFWKLWEGPFVMVFGSVLFWLSLRIPARK